MTDDVVGQAADQLYAVAPDQFMTLRAELAAAARKDGDAAAAKRIGALRKPTVSASIVNRLVHDDPPVVEHLVDLGDRMRAAQAELDAATLRDLSVERRTTVAELARRALKLSGLADPSSTVRDEVVDSFDAAVADPEIAANLGRLTRAEKWSGFGVAVAGTPELTLVRGGRDRSPTSKAQTPEPGQKKPTAAETAARKRAEKAAATARAAFEKADGALADAEAAEEASVERVHQLGAALADLQEELETAKRDREAARRALRSARSRRREARSALDRAERQLPT